MADRPTSQDVLLALLALDSYSRGENAQLLNKDLSQLATTIGSANWNFDSDDMEGALSTGFSASKYTLTDGKTVIAYRGTDFTSNFGVVKDIGAWMSSFGVVGDSIGGVKLQPYYAQKFYEDVTHRSLFPGGSGTPGSNVLVTGHSLGGSLAGYVASLSHDQAVIFNEIPELR
jgi:hypothetical protein